MTIGKIYGEKGEIVYKSTSEKVGPREYKGVYETFTYEEFDEENNRVMRYGALCYTADSIFAGLLEWMKDRRFERLSFEQLQNPTDKEVQEKLLTPGFGIIHAETADKYVKYFQERLGVDQHGRINFLGYILREGPGNYNYEVPGLEEAIRESEEEATKPIDEEDYEHLVRLFSGEDWENCTTNVEGFEGKRFVERFMVAQKPCITMCNTVIKMESINMSYGKRVE